MADTQQALKDRIVAALIMNNWDSVFKEWWLSYNRRSVALDQALTDRSVGAYLDRMADDIAAALIDGSAAPSDPHTTTP